MGTTKMEELETTGTKTPKIQEKTRRTSADSSIAPKAAQPSCLRGAFICLFLKRAEQVNCREDSLRKKPNTEDNEDVKGKKRRVVGASIFQLPCLRPAERTGIEEQINKPQEKMEEQSNQIIAIEELKPYSKASFLRKIRGYRLMRESDAKEKEKVIEIGQNVHGMESAMGMEHQEQNNLSDQGENVIEHSHEDEKGNGLAGGECQTDRLGGLGKNLPELDGQAERTGVIDNSLRQQDISTEKIEEKKKDVLEQESQIGGKDNTSAKQDCKVEKVEKLENSLESTSSGAGVMEIVRESCAEKLEDLGSQLLEHTSQAEEVQKQGKDSPTPKNQANKVCQLDKDFKEEKCQLEEMGKVRDDFPELESSSEGVQNFLEQDINAEEVGKVLPEQESSSEELGNVVNELQEQKILHKQIEKVERLSEQESETLKVGHHLVEQENQPEKVEKLGDNLREEESKIGKDGHHLVDQENQPEKVEKLGDNLRERESKTGKDGHHLVDQENPTSEVEKLGDNLREQESNTGKVGHHLAEQESHKKEVEKSGDNVPEQGSEAAKVGDYLVDEESHKEVLVKNLVKQESHAEKIVRNYSEHDSHVKMLEDGKNLLENKGDGEIDQELQNNLFETDLHVDIMETLCQTNSQVNNVGEQGNDPLEKGSYKEKVEERMVDFSEDVREQKEDKVAHENDMVGESADNTTDFSQTSSMAKGKQLVPDGFNGNLTQEGTTHNLNQELEVSEEYQQDSLTSRTGDSGETKTPDPSVRMKTMVTNTRNNTMLQERHTPSVELQEEKTSSSSHKVDPTNKEQESNQKGISNKEDAMRCKDTDFGSLREEVKDMVQWLVEEASDRLTNYSEESHGTT